MIKMIIKMNEGRITSMQEYTAEQIYKELDSIFAQMGYSSIKTNGHLEYLGHEDPRDFGRFGRIYNTLKRQRWFVDNASQWLLCNSDDVEDVNDFSEEDLLEFCRQKATERG